MIYYQLNLLGPYYSFRTWTDMYGQRWSRWANCDKALIERGYILPVYVILFILSGRFFPLDIVKGEYLKINDKTSQPLNNSISYSDDEFNFTIFQMIHFMKKVAYFGAFST